MNGVPSIVTRTCQLASRRAKRNYIVGDLMTPVKELYPVRYRVSEFPTPGQLERIGMEEM